jgi:bZIP factor
MMSQFMLDIKHEDLRKVPVTHYLKEMRNRYSPIQEPREEVLDLSKRRDSIETRKTPSPYNTSEERSPNNSNSPLSSRVPERMSRTPEHVPQINGFLHDRISPISHSLSVNQRTPPPGLYPPFSGFPFMPFLPKLNSLSPNESTELENHSIPPSQAFYMQSQPIPVPQQHLFKDNDESNDNFSDHSPVEVSSISSSTSQKTNSPSSSSNIPMVVGRDGKLSRPFKAYPRDPLSLAAGTLLDSNSAEKYHVFRKRMLEQIHAANGGNPTISNPKMRRMSTKSVNVETNNNEVPEPEEEKKPQPIITNQPSNGLMKDSSYYERRKKNNAAAKKSRDRRRIKEDEIAIRAAFLERENIELKFELAAIRKQLAMYTSSVPN